jgi:hypothetical protein
MLLGTVFVLYYSPGSSFSAVPIYFSQAYLFVVINLGTGDNQKHQMRSAVAVSIFCAVAAVVGSLAATHGVTSTYDTVIANIHLGIVVSVSLIIVGSCVHIWQVDKLGELEQDEDEDA